MGIFVVESLTSEQSNVLDGTVKDVLSGKKTVSVGGYAGTGKSVVLRETYERLLREGLNVGVGAPTGKAASVQSTRGCPCSTIHNLFYRLEGKVVDEKPCKCKKYPCPICDDTGIAKTMVDLHFEFRGNHKQFDVVLIDEASMVPHWMHKNISSCCQIVYFGDHGQLPAIGSNYSIMLDPDYRLETIHRNAGPIAHFCEYLRNGGAPKLWKGQGVRFVELYRELEDKNVQILCGLKQTRKIVNDMQRQHFGMVDPLEYGDSLICLQNKPNLELYNGSQIQVLQVHSAKMLEVACNGIVQKINVDLDVLGKKDHDLKRGNGMPVDYGYCLTVHKSQGSEWDDVAVIDEAARLFYKEQYNVPRWRYTAASRAKKSLTWITSARLKS